MTYAEIKARNVKLLLVDETQAGAMCGKVTIFNEIRDRYKLRPIVQKKSVVLYSAEQIEAAVGKLILEKAQLNA